MILHSSEIADKHLSFIGGKTKGLLNLSSYNVPEWWVLPVGEKITLADLNRIPKSETFPYFAVRSSALNEDGDHKSFAGMYESRLFIDYESLLENIQAIQKSNQSKRIKAYTNEQSELAIIIQRMIPADFSGVILSRHPITGKHEAQINLVEGLGEALVSGEVNAQFYAVKQDKIEKQDSQPQDKKLIFQNGQLGYVPAKNTEISEKLIQQISQIAEKLDQSLSCAQDIEFCFYKSELFILQSRPITTIKEEIIWDNSNIIESYPGLSSPLTFSFIQKNYTIAYTQFCDLLGVPKKDVKMAQPYLNEMLGLVNGNVYYHLLNWYRVLSLLPGYQLNKERMEQMMGVKEPLDRDVALIKNRSRLFLYFRTAISYTKIFTTLIKLNKERQKFKQLAQNKIRKTEQLQLQTMNKKELWELYQHFEKELILKWQAPLSNDFFAMVYFGKVKKHFEEQMDGSEYTVNHLLAASEDIESIDPLKILAQIKKLLSHEEVSLLRSELSAEEKLKRWKKTQSSSWKLAEQFLNKFGHRISGELKLETHTYKSHPKLFIELIKAQIDNHFSYQQHQESVIEKRHKAEKAIYQTYGWKFWKKRKFKKDLRHCRKLVSERENLRLIRTQAFGVVRMIFREIGQQLHQEKKLENPEDVFQLSLSELEQACIYDKEVQGIIKKSKENYQLWKNGSLPDRFSQFGSFLDIPETSSTPSDLSGIGCSPGVVEKEVVVLNGVQEAASLEGKILVTHCTDPGWVTLFPSCGGILVERGSLLSHSAIVSREMGIPCIVAINGIMQKLKTGDKVRMDGSTGKIEIIHD